MCLRNPGFNGMSMLRCLHDVLLLYHREPSEMQQIQGHGSLLVFAQCHFMLIESPGATQNALFSSCNEDILSPCRILRDSEGQGDVGAQRKGKATCLRSATRGPGIFSAPSFPSTSRGSASRIITVFCAESR